MAFQKGFYKEVFYLSPCCGPGWSLYFLTIIFFGTAGSVLAPYADSMRYKFEIELLIYALFFGLIGYTLNYLYILSGHTEDLTSDKPQTKI